jgi:molybdate transport system permease protein
MVLPPTVLGFFLLVLLGPRTALGRGIAALLGHPLAFSFDGLVVGSVIYSLPFAVQPLIAGFASVDTALVDAARLLGAGPVRLVSSILLPLSRRSLLAAVVLSFLHTIGEFPAPHARSPSFFTIRWKTSTTPPLATPHYCSSA